MRTFGEQRWLMLAEVHPETHGRLYHLYLFVNKPRKIVFGQ